MPKGSSEGSTTVVYTAVAANLAITVTKFVAAVLTGSASMLIEFVHSVVDTGNEALMLIGESAQPHLVKGVRAILEAKPVVEHVNEVLAMHLGPDTVVANLSLDFRDDVAAGHVEEAMARIDRTVKARYPEIRRVFTEFRSARVG
ncbi:cation transporter [Azospirillum sp. sgz301742]